MNVQRSLGIKDYLQQKEVQERIQKGLQDALSNVTVFTSRAASLFGFSESQLRDWEKKGLLESDRTALAQDGKGHRQYTTNELSKLAVFQELIKEGRYSLGEIRADLDGIRQHIEHGQQNHVPARFDLAISTMSIAADSIPKKHIDQRVEHAEQEVFWRYFTSQALRLSLMLICENMPDVAGLILPLNKNAPFIRDPKEIYKFGESLIGWLSENRSFNTFLDSAPSFEAPTDFRIEPFPISGEDGTLENAHLKNTMIVVQRKARNLNLSGDLVQTVQRLLTSLYCNIEKWKSTFDVGMRDYLSQFTEFTARQDTIDATLTRMTDMVVELGGKASASSTKNRWNFCCIMLPVDSYLPIQQRSLVIRAQSSQSPYIKLGNIVLTPDNPGLNLRAYQSGTMIYRLDIPEKDNRSALALPIAREDGLSIGVLYVASEAPHAFTVEDQRVLRLIGTMVSELLLTYRARQRITGKRSDLIEQHEILEIKNVTVRLGIPAYKRSKLRQILGRFQHSGSENPIANTRDTIITAIEQVLKQGSRCGGNNITSWDYDDWDYGLWEPQKGWAKNN